MLNQNTQGYKLQYPDCFINEEQRMIQKIVADFVDKEIMPVRHKIDDDVTHEQIVEPILKKLQIGLGWQKAMIHEFARKCVGDKLRFACFNMSEVESACDIENHLNEARLIRTKAKLMGNEWVINGY